MVARLTGRPPRTRGAGIAGYDSCPDASSDRHRGGGSERRGLEAENPMSRCSGSRLRDGMYTGLAVAAGVSIGWLDLQTTEVTVTVAALLLAGALLGFLRPRAAWRPAVVLALGLPVVAIVGHLLRVRTAEPIRLDPRIALVGLMFALAGSYGGAAVGRALARRRDSD